MSAPAGLGGRAVGAFGVRLAVGLVLVVAGWLGARDEVALDRQAPWIAVAVTGLLVGAAASALWLLGLRRTVTARTLAVVAAVDGLLMSAPSAAVADDAVRVRRVGGGSLVHRPGCALVAGRAVAVVSATTARRGALQACEACDA